MRKVARNLEKKLSEIVASDEMLASKMTAGASFIDTFERSLNDYCDTLIREVNIFREHLKGELQQLKPILSKAASELRGDEMEPAEVIIMPPQEADESNVATMPKRDRKA